MYNSSNNNNNIHLQHQANHNNYNHLFNQFNNNKFVVVGNQQPQHIVVTYVQLDSNIHVLYIFLFFFKNTAQNTYAPLFCTFLRVRV